jgi:integrase
MAEKLAAETAQAPSQASTEPLLEYVAAFWQPDSPYVREKALVEHEPVSAHYLLTNRQMVKNKMEPFPEFAGLTLGGLTKGHLRRWKLFMAEQGTSGRMINQALLALRVPVCRAFSDDLIPADPFAGVQRAAHKEKARGILTPAEIRTLLETPVTDPRSRLAVYLSLYCSMRMGEVRGLLWEDISDGVIHICHNWQEKEGIKGCKKGSEGYVPMVRAVAELVNAVRKTCPLTGPRDFVMSLKPYHPISREYLWESMSRELAVIGITEEDRKRRNIVFHSLRHSFVTLGRLAGMNDAMVMALARHKDAKMMARYSHLQEGMDMARARGLIEAFGGGNPGP